MEAGNHAGENPAGRIKRFATESDVRNEAVRPKPQAGHRLSRQAITKVNLIKMSIERTRTGKPRHFRGGEGCQEQTGKPLASAYHSSGVGEDGMSGRVGRVSDLRNCSDQVAISVTQDFGRLVPKRSISGY